MTIKKKPVGGCFSRQHAPKGGQRRNGGVFCRGGKKGGGKTGGGKPRGTLPGEEKIRRERGEAGKHETREAGKVTYGKSISIEREPSTMGAFLVALQFLSVERRDNKQRDGSHTTTS